MQPPMAAKSLPRSADGCGSTLHGETPLRRPEPEEAGRTRGKTGGRPLREEEGAAAQRPPARPGPAPPFPGRGAPRPHCGSRPTGAHARPAPTPRSAARPPRLLTRHQEGQKRDEHSHGSGGRGGAGGQGTGRTTRATTAAPRVTSSGSARAAGTAPSSPPLPVPRAPPIAADAAACGEAWPARGGLVGGSHVMGGRVSRDGRAALQMGDGNRRAGQARPPARDNWSRVKRVARAIPGVGSGPLGRSRGVVSSRLAVLPGRVACPAPGVAAEAAWLVRFRSVVQMPSPSWEEAGSPVPHVGHKE